MNRTTKRVSARVRDNAVEVLRDEEGKLYSQVRDRNLKEGERYHDLVVIDRQRGRILDADTVRRRAEALADVLGLELVVDLTWPCIAKRGKNDCRCPECADALRARKQ